MTAAIPPSIGARLRPALLLATIAGLWAAGWVAGGFLLTKPEASNRAIGLSLPAMVARAFGMRTPPNSLMAPWFVEIVLVSALATFAVFAIVAFLDCAGHSTRALRWSLRTLPCLAAWGLIASACAWLTSLTPLHEYAWAVICIAVLVAPFLFLRADVVTRDRPPFFWGPA